MSALADSHSKDDNPAASRIRGLGGDVEIDKAKPGRPIIKVIFQGVDVKDSDLACLDGLKDLQVVVLCGGHISDAGVARLKPMNRLKVLHLGYTDITDAALITVGSLDRLETLMLDGNKITDAGLRHIKVRCQSSKTWFFHERR